MQFCFSDISALKPNCGNTFKFSPSTGAVLLPKPHDISNLSTYGNLFNSLNFTYYLKIHAKIHYLISSFFHPTKSSLAGRAAQKWPKPPANRTWQKLEKEKNRAALPVKCSAWLAGATLLS